MTETRCKSMMKCKAFFDIYDKKTLDLVLSAVPTLPDTCGPVGLLNSDMVVLPVFDQRTSTDGSATEVARTSTKLVPRKGVTESWRDEMSDILAAKKLGKVAAEQHPPRLDYMQAELHGFPEDEIKAMHKTATEMWWSEATRLYQVVRASVDLTGIYEKKDLAMIKKTTTAMTTGAMGQLSFGGLSASPT